MISTPEILQTEAEAAAVQRMVESEQPREDRKPLGAVFHRAAVDA